MINRVTSDGPIVFTGGVAKNPCMVELLYRKLNREIRIPADPQLAGGQFMQVGDSDVPGLEISERVGVDKLNLPNRLSEHEIQIHFKVAALAGVTLVIQAPLSTGMFGRHPFGGEPFPGKYCLERLFDLGPVSHHGLSIQRPDVVKIDIHR